MSNAALGRLIGAGKEAEVFEYGVMVVKLYKQTAPKRSAFREAANLSVAESFGLPAPRVHGVKRIGDRWGVIMGRAYGGSFAETVRRQPDLLPEYLNAIALLQLRLHGHSGFRLASLKAWLAANIQEAVILGTTRQDNLLSQLALLPDRGRLCHGDFHPLNILGLPPQEMIVDWLTARSGDPVADVCRSYVLIRRASPEIASAYIDAYVGVSGENRESILRWLPVVAAARLAEGVPNETNDLITMVDGP